MKRIVLLAIALLSVAGLAFGQTGAGSIGIFSDQAGTSCNITDAVPGLLPVYLLHVNTVGASASQFIVDVGGFTASLIGESAAPGMLANGTALGGLAVAYGSSCVTGTFLIYSLNFFASGTTPACALMSILPDPLAPTGQIEGADCQVPPAKIFPSGGQARVNPDAGCMCDVPVETSTWGKIKSLYR